MLTLIAAAVLATAAATPPHYTLVEVKNSPRVLSQDAYAINDQGVIGGVVTLPDYTTAAYVQRSNSRHFTSFKPFGGPFNRVNAIAPNGDIAGAASNPGIGLEGQRAFMVISGQLIAPFPDAPNTMGTANAINAKGAATGSRSVSGGSQLGWIYDRGQVSAIPSFGGSASVGNAINAHGSVAGIAQETGDDTWTPFLYRHGAMKRLPMPVDREICTINGINNADAVVGHCFHKDKYYHAEVWRDGAVTELPALIPGGTVAAAINDAGVVVGWSLAGKRGFETHAVVWIDDQVWDLNDITTLSPGVRLTNANGITTDGRILVQGDAGDAVTRNYVLTPEAAVRPADQPAR